MPPSVRDRRTKRKHPKPAPVITLATFPTVPKVQRGSKPPPPHRIFNPALADPAHPTLVPPGHTADSGHLAFNPFDYVIPGLHNLPGPDVHPGDLPGKAADALGGVGINNPLTGTLDALNWILNPSRLVKVAGGGILILMGLHQLTKQLTGSTPAGHVRKAVSTVGTALAMVPK